MFGSYRLKQRSIDLYRYITRKQIIEEPPWRLLVDVVSGSELSEALVLSRGIGRADSNAGGRRSFGRLGSLFLRKLIGLLDIGLADLGDWQYMVYNKSLRYHRFEFVVDQIHGIDFLAG